ncbi:alpha/beta fold hydrolase [Streptomyces sp. NPDC085524]|uniref:alpha/beta fold hydrolase n=1 Tax=unclassified Streptomyces TaxID=2593676 RepID=UPI0035DF2ECF
MTARLQRARPGSPELQALVDELAERLVRSVAVDLRGHGKSGKPHHGHLIAPLSRDALELVGHLGHLSARTYG